MFITVTNYSLQRVKRVRVNNMHRDAGRWRHGGAFIPLSFQKRSNGGWGAFFIIGLGAGTFLGLRRIFARISPNFPEVFCATFSYKLSSQRSLRPFWCDLQTRSSCVFLQTLGAVFWSQATKGVRKGGGWGLPPLELDILQNLYCKESA